MGAIIGLSKISGASDPRLDSASAISVISTPDDGRGLLLVSSRSANRISKVGLTSNGVLSVDLLGLGESDGKLRGAGDSAISYVDGAPILVSTASFDNAVTVSTFVQFGRIKPIVHIQDDVTFDNPEDGVIALPGVLSMSLSNADSVESFTIDGEAFFVVGGSFDDGISLFSYNLSGGSTLVANVTDAEEHHLNRVEDVAYLEVDGRHFVITVSPSEQGVSVFHLADKTSLSNTDNVSSGPEFSLGILTSVETTVIGDKGFVLVGGFGDASITVFELGSDGELEIVDQVVRQDVANISRLFSLEVFEIEGRTYVAAGGDRGSINVFAIGDDGHLTLSAELEGSDSPRADPTTDIAAHQFGEKTILIASGQDGDGIATFRFFEDAIGKTHIGGDGKDILKGREKGDILVGAGGNDRLKGKSGHDRILDGEGKDHLWGGSGRDVFEFTEDSQQDKIMDFEDGRDIIDFSGFVNQFADLAIEQIATGAVSISYEEDVFIVKGFKKSAITVDMLDESDFIFVEDQFV